MSVEEEFYEKIIYICEQKTRVLMPSELRVIQIALKEMAAQLRATIKKKAKELDDYPGGQFYLNWVLSLAPLAEAEKQEAKEERKVDLQ